jgi:hypothetical protein
MIAIMVALRWIKECKKELKLKRICFHSDNEGAVNLIVNRRDWFNSISEEHKTVLL